MRFVKRSAVTTDGEVAHKKVYTLDQEQIQKEEIYDSYYAVMTNLETIRSMRMTLLNTASGYVPSYTRTDLTDALHREKQLQSP